MISKSTTLMRIEHQIPLVFFLSAVISCCNSRQFSSQQQHFEPVSCYAPGGMHGVSWRSPSRSISETSKSMGRLFSCRENAINGTPISFDIMLNLLSSPISLSVIMFFLGKFPLHSYIYNILDRQRFHVRLLYF